MDTLAKARSSPASGGIPSIAFLPAESPMDMAVQPLRRFAPPPAPRFAPMWARRAFILAGTAVLTAAGCYEMYSVLKVGGITILELIILGLFVLLFAWIAFSFMSALAGFAVLLFRKKDELGIDSAAPLPAIRSRTAMLLPTYNEDPYRVLARLRAIYESVEETGNGSNFDWFVLSDTTDPAIWIAEEKCFVELRQEVGIAARIFYRHRPENTARKSGNIEEWIRRFGSDYECMLILDADSLMTGDTIVRLVAAMEEHPKVASDPDAADRRQCKVLVCEMAAIRRAIIRSAAGCGDRMVARLRRQLLGTQRHHPRPCLCAVCRASRTGRTQAVWRTYSQPRLHRSSDDAARRLGHPHGAKARRKLRRIPAHAFGFCRARQALVPGQSTASGAASNTRLSLGFAPSFADGYWIVSHRAALADLSGVRNLGIAAGAIRPAGVLPEGLLAVSTMAGARSDTGGVGLRRHDGNADCAKAARLPRAADGSRHTEEVRWRPSGTGRHYRRDDPFGPDRACHDDLPILRRQRSPVGT